MHRNILFILIPLFIGIVATQTTQAQNLSDESQTKISEYSSVLNQATKQGDKVKAAEFCNKLGFLYWDNQLNDKAIEYFNQSLSLNEQIGNKNAQRVLNKNLGLIYSDVGNYPKSLLHLRKSLEINTSLSKKADIISDQLAVGAVLSYDKKYTEAIAISLKALEGAKELNEIKLIKNCYSQLAECYEKAGNPEKSFEYFQQYTSIQKHMQAEELQELEQKSKQVDAKIKVKNKELEAANDRAEVATVEASVALESKKQAERMAELLSAENDLQEAKLKASRYMLGIMAGGSILIILIAILVYIQFRNKKKANKLLKTQHEEIVLQKQEIEKQHEIVNVQTKKIKDSIQYASRIQRAVLPPDDFISKVANEHFILFKPRDIVSGDFYWMTQKDNLIVIAAADCTGHGVPGAFMSMLGISFLNEIVNKVTVNKHLNALSTDEILNQLRNSVISSLHQTGNRKEPKDGMDIAISIIDTENMKLQFSGAHNPLYIIRNNELLQFPGDKMPISYHQVQDTSFTRHDVDIENGDVLYLFTDGYVDQFGGKNGRKYLVKNFRKLLLDIHQKPLNEQKQILNEKIETWRGDRGQLDDILVIGFKVTPEINKLSDANETNWADKSILIAEDTDVNYLLLVEALRSTKVGVVRAMNGEEAVNYCKRRDFDVVLMDINMPVMDGHEATRQIKALKPDLPIIVQTALYGPDDAQDSLSAGADAYIAKPIDLKTFMKKIATFIDK